MSSKRNFLVGFVSLLACFFITVCLTACGNDKCTHAWSEWETNVAATCEVAGEKTRTCSKCEEVEKDVLPALGHAYGSWIEEVAASCENDGTLGHYHCETCGKDFDTNHNILNDLKIESEGHTWKDATCTEAKKCTTCNATEGEALGHTPGAEATCESAQTCTVCNEVLVEALGHAWDDGEVTTNPTCEAQGVKTFTCSTCGEKKTEEIAALGHTPGAEATCENAQTCTVCNEVLVEALGHAWDDGEVTTNPTCEAQGVKTFTCSTCGEKKTEEIAALGHTEEVLAGKAATCTETGLTEGKKCSVCEKVLVAQTEINALGHKEEVIPAVAATCESTGLTEGKKCSVCGEILKAQEEIEALGHTWGEGEVTTAPTCETKGVKTFTCSVCKEEKTEEIAALGHKYAQKVAIEEYNTGKATYLYYYSCSCGAAGSEVFASGEVTLYLAPGPWNVDGAKFAIYYWNDATGNAWTPVTPLASGTSLCVFKIDAEAMASGLIAVRLNGSATTGNWDDKWNQTADLKLPLDGNDTLTITGWDASNYEWSKHTHTEVVDQAVAATCTTSGLTEGKHCSGCGLVTIAQEEVAALGHTEVKLEAVEPTCTETGLTEGKKCSVCDEIIEAQEEVEALGHKGGEATCTEKAICTVCNQPYGTTLEHTFNVENTDAIYRDSLPTCEAPATYFYTCTCGAKGTETFTYGEALGHNYTGFVSNGDGTHTNVCKNNSEHNITEECSGGEATCTDKAICSKCSTAYGALPTHSWNEGEVTTNATCTVNGVITYTCSICDDTKTTDIPALGHEYSAVVKEPTCTEKGYTTYTCSVCSDSYIGAEVAALGHEWDNEELTCELGRSCLNCDAVEEALGHDYQYETVEATCTEAGLKTTTCSRCEYNKSEELGTALGHDFTGVTPEEVLVSGHETCYYVQVSNCNNCGEAVYGENVEHHSYVASISEEPTCKTPGSKLFTCKDCGHSYDEEVAANANSHTWNEGTLEGKIRTFTCLECDATKEIVDASASSSAEVNADDLAATGQVQLKDAAMNMDDATLEAISGKNVTLSAGTLEGEDLDSALSTLDEKQKEQLGNNPIYNFTMESDGKAITTFDGFITITLPYELEEGEDVDSIAVWYMGTEQAKDEEGNLLFDEEGNPVLVDKVFEIKATYSNGFVTFQTNHFSYYTVTRLTPTQRCELYGHNFSDKKVAGSCTSDEYTVHFCIRCAYSYKEVTVVADGHDYSAVRTEPTCTTNGNILYTCRDCGHAYNERINAIGHSYVETSRVEATCDVVGSVKYECANCDASYTERLAQLQHQFVDEEINPTCEKHGYTNHSCVNCGYEYNDNMKPALGHKYDYNFQWNEDYSKAEVEFRCQNGCDHSFVKEAEIDTKVTEPTCSANGQRDYHAKVSHNGETFYDEKHVQDNNRLDHNYENHFKHDKDGHWHECQDCGHKETTIAHEYGEGVMTIAPTCVAKGEMVYSCACGEIKKEVIPATGEHFFEKGSCVFCGKVDSLCDHTELHEVVYNLADYGTCGGVIAYYTCACGEVTVIDQDRFEPECNLDYLEMDEGMVGEDRQFMSAKALCPDCGLYLDMYAEAYKEGCNMIMDYTMTFIINDQPIFENLAITMVEEYHNSNNRVVLDLSQYSSCGGTITGYQCVDCGLFTSVSNMSINCDVEEAETEEFVDENGYQHQKMTATCPNCGLYFENDMYLAVYSQCEQEMFMNMSIYHNDELVFTYTDSQYSSNHDYTRTYTLKGETCEDGYTVHEVCSICGDESSWTSKGHREEYKEIDLTEYGLCGGCANVHYCEICDKFIDTEYLDPQCNPDILEQKEFVDENGFVHVQMRAQCTNCGKIIVGEIWEEVVSECEKHSYVKYSFYEGEELIVEFISHEEENNHNYVREYTLNGESCKEGYTVYQYCTICGKEETWNSSGHNYNHTEIDLAQYGMCEGGTASVTMCEICKEISYVHYLEPACKLEGQETGEYVDENGVAHMTMNATCPDCGIIISADMWEVRNGECYVTRYMKYVFANENEVVLEFTQNTSSANHNYEEKYTLNGASCEDGYHYERRCTICGEGESGEGKGHRTEFVKVDLVNEYGACAGMAAYEQCRICNEVTYVEGFELACPEVTHENFTQEDENGVMHEILITSCPTCGLTYQLDRYAGQASGCVYTYNEHILLHDSEQTFIDLIRVNRHETHNYEESYELYGKTCDEGYRVNITCTKCGKSSSYNTSGHRTDYVHEELSEKFGLCGGYISYHSCRVCSTITSVESMDIKCEEFHNTQPEEIVDESGNIRYVVAVTCSHCQITINAEMWQEFGNACNRYEYYHYEFYNNEELINSFEYHRTFVEHEYETSYKKYGETCEDGYMAYQRCVKCGEQSEWESYGHHTKETNFELSEYGACHGNINYNYCMICNEVTYFDYRSCANHQISSEDYTDDAGVIHSLSTNVCPEECGLIVIVDQYRVFETACKGYYVQKFIFTYNGEEFFTGSRKSYFDNHEWKYTYQLFGKTCDEGYIINGVCLNCHETTSWEQSGHSAHPIERFDIAEMGGCGGFVTIYSCACGEDSWTNFEPTCDIRHTHNEYIDEEGKLIEVDVYTCANCELRHQYSAYSIKNEGECFKTNYYTETLNIGSEVLFNIEYSEIESMHSYEASGQLHEGASSCEEGVTITYRCRECGDSYSNEYNWHIQFTSEVIDLNEYDSCGGYIYVKNCACQQNAHFEFDSLCHFSQICEEEVWIENTLADGHYETLFGKVYINNYAEYYICSVTDPVQCEFKVRIAHYWLQDADSCYGVQYQTMQVGYDDVNDTYQYEITFAGDKIAFHHFVEKEEKVTEGSTISTIRTRICSVCDSSYKHEGCCESETGELLYHEYEYINNLEEDQDQYRYQIDEYENDPDYGCYISHQYLKQIDPYGNEYWEEMLYDYNYEYVGQFGDVRAYETTQTRTDSNGRQSISKHGYDYYKDYRYEMYEYELNNEEWERRDYTYSFDGGCMRTTVYTSSYNETWEESYEYHIATNSVVDKPATCTQDGFQRQVCHVCEFTIESLVTEPTDHCWLQISDDHYFCSNCGLENTNGASGDIVIEDLTAQYGEDINYVLGYYARNEVEFSYYVSLILHEAAEDGNNEVILNPEEIEYLAYDGIRAIGFNRANVEALALALGYTADMYDVRFTFVPIGADGSYDYGITFTNEEINTLNGPAEYVAYVEAGEVVTVTITVEETGEYYFRSHGATDTYGYLRNAEGKDLARDDDSAGDGNFGFYCQLEAGVTYQFTYRWYNEGKVGYMGLSVSLAK